VLTNFGDLTVADLVAGPAADVRLDRVATLPWVSGDQPASQFERPTLVKLTPDGNTVAFIRFGALWTQPAKAGVRAALVSSGLDGRIADPVSETYDTADRVVSYGIDGTGRTLAFQSDSTAFVSPRSSHDPREVLPAYLYRAVPTATAPGWPAGAGLETEPGTTSVTVRWPAAIGEVAGYDVTVNGKPVARIGPGTTTALLNGLDAGSTVEIAVRAVDAEGHASTPLMTSVTLLGSDTEPPTMQVTGVRDGATYVLGAVPVAGCTTSDAGSGEATVSVTGGDPRGVGTFTVTCARGAEQVTVRYSVIYAFTWMTPPSGDATVKAGKELNMIWKIADSHGNGIGGLQAADVTVNTRSCGASDAAWVTEPLSRVQLRELPHGHYQLGWSTPTSYGGGCRQVRLDIGEGVAALHLVEVRFIR
jgi:hypothetical protein